MKVTPLDHTIDTLILLNLALAGIVLVATLCVQGLRRFNERRKAEYLPLVRIAYQVLDPILCAYAGKLSGTELMVLVHQAMQLLDDGARSEQERYQAVKLFWQLFDLRVATEAGLRQPLDLALTPTQHLEAAVARFKNSHFAALES